MIESNPNLPNLTDRANGEAAMSRLADRLVAMAPQAVKMAPPQAVNLAPQTILPPSPAVAAALATSAAIARRAHQRARRSRSIIGLTVDSFVSACSFVPYALVALAVRVIMAGVFFLDGQTRIAGLRLTFHPADYANLDFLRGLDFSIVLPMQVKAETFTAFAVQYPALPVPAVLAAYLVSYAEFILPVMLLIGLGTRFAAMGLLIMTAMISIFVMPQALLTTHIYWAALLTLLVSLGAGALSVDHAIRKIAGR